MIIKLQVTVNIQVTAVFLRSSGKNQVISGFDLKIVPLVLILKNTAQVTHTHTLPETVPFLKMSVFVFLTVSLMVMYGSSSLVPNTVNPARLSPRFDAAAEEKKR